MSKVLTWREVKARIDEGNFKMNPYALDYYGALERSYNEYGDSGLRTQIVYIFANIRAFKGIQQTIKKELMDYAKEKYL